MQGEMPNREVELRKRLWLTVWWLTQSIELDFPTEIHTCQLYVLGQLLNLSMPGTLHLQKEVFKLLSEIILAIHAWLFMPGIHSSVAIITRIFVFVTVSSSSNPDTGNWMGSLRMWVQIMRRVMLLALERMKRKERSHKWHRRRVKRLWCPGLQEVLKKGDSCDKCFKEI